MASREYSRLIGIFQRVINREGTINNNKEGIYGDERSLILLQDFIRSAKKFVSRSGNDEQERNKIRSLISEGDTIINQTGKITKHNKEKFAVAAA